jgi:hypothetical protein
MLFNSELHISFASSGFESASDVATLLVCPGSKNGKKYEIIDTWCNESTLNRTVPNQSLDDQANARSSSSIHNKIIEYTIYIVYMVYMVYIIYAVFMG